MEIVGHGEQKADSSWHVRYVERNSSLASSRGGAIARRRVVGDAGYQGVENREKTQDVKASWHIAMRPGKRRALHKATALGRLLDECERLKARVRARVEHPFRVIKRQFGHLKVHYRGLMKNTQQLHTLFALSILWMMRRRILQHAKA
jgi:IS5 family transposase